MQLSLLAKNDFADTQWVMVLIWELLHTHSIIRKVF